MLHIETKINPAPEAGSMCLIIQDCCQTLQQTQQCDTDTAQLQAGASEVETNMGHQHQEDTASSGAQSGSALLLQ